MFIIDFLALWCVRAQLTVRVNCNVADDYEHAMLPRLMSMSRQAHICALCVLRTKRSAHGIYDIISIEMNACRNDRKCAKGRVNVSLHTPFGSSRFDVERNKKLLKVKFTWIDLPQQQHTSLTKLCASET